MITKVTTAKNPPVLGKISLELLVWTAGTIIAVFWLVNSASGDAKTQATIFAGVLSIIFGLRVFLVHGHGRITVTGLFNLSTAMFIGYAGIIVATGEEYVLNPHYLGVAVVGGWVAQLGTTALAWGSNGSQSIPINLAPREVANWAAKTGFFALLAITIADVAAKDTLGPYTESAAFVAICVLAVGLLWRAKARIISWSSILLVGTFAMYAEWFHSGQGRLRIVALACVIGVLYAARFQRRTIKYAIVVLIPFALAWLAVDRLALQESLNAGGSTGRTGLESMLSPTVVFAELLESQAAGFPIDWGYSLLSFPALFVPSEIWPSQPRALGYDLVAITAPEKVGSGYSVVASYTGEAVYNFGMLGFLIVIPVVACLLRFLDKRFVHSLQHANPTELGLLGIVFWAMCAGSIADFTWSGQHTYLARIATRLPLLLGLIILAWVHGSKAENASKLTVQKQREARRRAELKSRAFGPV